MPPSAPMENQIGNLIRGNEKASAIIKRVMAEGRAIPAKSIKSASVRRITDAAMVAADAFSTAGQAVANAIKKDRDAMAALLERIKTRSAASIERTIADAESIPLSILNPFKKVAAAAVQARRKRRRSPGMFLSPSERKWVEMKVQAAGGGIDRRSLRTKLQREALSSKVNQYGQMLSEARNMRVEPVARGRKKR